MNRISILAAGIASLVFAASVEAGTVTLELTVDTVAKTWEMRASITDTTSSSGAGFEIEGILAYDLAVLGQGGLVVDSGFTNGIAPRNLQVSKKGGGIPLGPPVGPTIPTSAIGNYGFHVLPYDGEQSGTNWVSIFAGQFLSNDFTYRRVGLEAAFHTTNIGTEIWDANVLLAIGTYTGDCGTLTATTANPDFLAGFILLRGLEGPDGWVGPRNVEYATAVIPSSVVVPPVPEPSTLVLAALGLAVFLPFANAMRRRIRWRPP